MTIAGSLFCNDIKLSMRIHSSDNCLLLQADIDSFYAWFSALGLLHNMSMCKIFTFAKLQSLVIFSYTFNAFNILRRNDSVLDIGFKFSSNLDPKQHIKYISRRALKSLGLVMRLANMHTLSMFLRALYCAHVHPILENGCISIQLVT